LTGSRTERAAIQRTLEEALPVADGVLSSLGIAGR
jgi:hypothetical protein